MAKRKGSPKAASSEERDAALIMGPADGTTSIQINHRLYRRSAYYRLLIRARLIADLWRSGHIDFDFVCSKNCCDLDATEEELAYQIWLDLPVGAPSLKREVTA